MDWKKESEEELREYAAKREALRNLPEEIAETKAEKTRLGGASSSRAPVKGGGSAWEDKQINLIAKEEKLEDSLAHAKKSVKRVEMGLLILNAEERLILERFYIHPEHGAADRLAGDLHADVKTVYRWKYAALRKYTLARYGCTEI